MNQIQRAVVTKATKDEAVRALVKANRHRPLLKNAIEQERDTLMRGLENCINALAGSKLDDKQKGEVRQLAKIAKRLKELKAGAV